MKLQSVRCFHGQEVAGRVPTEAQRIAAPVFNSRNAPETVLALVEMGGHRVFAEDQRAAITLHETAIADRIAFFPSVRDGRRRSKNGGKSILVEKGEPTLFVASDRGVQVAEPAATERTNGIDVSVICAGDCDLQKSGNGDIRVVMDRNAARHESWIAGEPAVAPVASTPASSQNTLLGLAPQTRQDRALDRQSPSKLSKLIPSRNWRIQQVVGKTVVGRVPDPL
ncbi:hypothetical protein ASG39_18415 [Rhizobium sp. Leaf371]|nr:hypothetical protein ASG39_18415 [Rhizobium sp. Leaf371]